MYGDPIGGIRVTQIHIKWRYPFTSDAVLEAGMGAAAVHEVARS